MIKDVLDFVSRYDLPVFPTKEKRPLQKGWRRKATTDHDTIVKWFTEDFKYADGFGVSPSDQCVVIDVDVKDGKPGAANLKHLIKSYDIDAHTLVVRTPSGGLHLYYKVPNFLKENEYVKSISDWCVDKKVLHGIDIRGAKGLAIGPYGGYTLYRDYDIAELPEILAKKLPIGSNETPNEEYAKQISESKIPDKIKKGGRHEKLNSLFGYWARKITLDQAVILLKEALNRCEDAEADGFTFDKYYPRLLECYKKYKPVTKNLVQHLLDRLIYVSNMDRVIDTHHEGYSKDIKISFARNKFANMIEFVEQNDGNYKEIDAFRTWLRHKERKEIPFIGYKPINDQYYMCSVEQAQVYNRYRGPKFDHPGEINVNPFIELIEVLWGDQAETILDWCAHMIQQPWKKMAWAPVIITTSEGMGKNMFLNCMSQAVGRNNVSEMNASIFNKSFNTFLVNKLIVLVNELQEVGGAARSSLMGKLKSYITDNAQTIEPKGIDPYDAEIFTNFIIFSNSITTLDIDDGSRRYFIHLNENKPQDAMFFKGISRWMKSEDGIPSLYYYLKSRNISEFEYDGRAPENESKKIVVEASENVYVAQIKYDIEERSSVFASDVITRPLWNYYLNNVLDLKNKKHYPPIVEFKSKHFKTIKNRHGNRQFNVPDFIEGMSEPDNLMCGGYRRRTLLVIRNHDKWIDRSGYLQVEDDEVVNEYRKVFKNSNSQKDLEAKIKNIEDYRT